MALTPEQRIPPKSAQDNAHRGLELRKKWGRGGLSEDEARRQGIYSGVTRARQLSSGDPVSEDTIRKMARFNRHRRNYAPDKKEPDGGPTAGTIAWLLWGGTEGIDWALRMVERMDKDKSGAHSMEMKKLVVPFSVKQMGEDDDFYTFEGYASTFGNVDLGADRVITGAFKDCINEYRRTGKNLPVLWQHDMSMPLGVYVEMEEDSKGLFVKGRMPKGDDFVRGRVMPQMKAGSVSAMSIGYVAKQWDIDGDVRNLKELMLYEISLVTMPMNPQAAITGMKSAVPFQDLPLADVERAWDSDAAVSRIREFLDSTEEPSDAYKRAFLCYDADDDENYGAYKLPIADVIEGRMMAVPRAIFAAAAAMQGARGGVNIPDSDVPAVRANIERYYAKMDRESPFETGKSILVMDIDMIKSLTERELDSVLRSGVRVTRSASKSLVSCLDVKRLRDADDSGTREAKNDDAEAWKSIADTINQISQDMEKK